MNEAFLSISLLISHFILVFKNFHYSAIGILDINDLVQAGHLGLLKAWDKIDWEQILESDAPEAKLWKFLKTRIKWEIRREIDKNASFMKLPINRQERGRNTGNYVDNIFVTMFNSFFDHAFFDYIDEIRPWDQEELLDLLNKVIPKYIFNHKHQELSLIHI